jgi:hypothetical protein
MTCDLDHAGTATPTLRLELRSLIAMQHVHLRSVGAFLVIDIGVWRGVACFTMMTHRLPAQVRASRPLWWGAGSS